VYSWLVFVVERNLVVNNIHQLVASIPNFVFLAIGSCFPQESEGFTSSRKGRINQIHYIISNISFDLVSCNNQFDLFHASKLFQFYSMSRTFFIFFCVTLCNTIQYIIVCVTLISLTFGNGWGRIVSWLNSIPQHHRLIGLIPINRFLILNGFSCNTNGYVTQMLCITM
jgi:hypothetical protein